jgi:hypothetical protein
MIRVKKKASMKRGHGHKKEQGGIPALLFGKRVDITR